MWPFQNINRGLELYRRAENALLVDVREPGEYAAGHIPGAVNVPLSTIDRADLPTDRPLFLYCLRGSRSARAAGILKRRGYGQVRSIGGINGYRGDLGKPFFAAYLTSENPVNRDFPKHQRLQIQGFSKLPKGERDGR